MLSNNEKIQIYCIYDAKGSIAGKFKYLIKKYFLGFECSMCIITHNSITSKSSWNYMISKFIYPIKTLHVDEQPEQIFNFTKGALPCVVGKIKSDLILLMNNDDLKSINGDVKLFFIKLENSLKSRISN
tara:strand:- start:614 stop:1000 length:387 start_codon:yes stop_codon:yes gene_type:complete